MAQKIFIYLSAYWRLSWAVLSAFLAPLGLSWAHFLEPSWLILDCFGPQNGVKDRPGNDPKAIDCLLLVVFGTNCGPMSFQLRAQNGIQIVVYGGLLDIFFGVLDRPPNSPPTELRRRQRQLRRTSRRLSEKFFLFPLYRKRPMGITPI